MRLHFSTLLILLAFANLLVACSEEPSAPRPEISGNKFIFAVNGPLQYFATQLIGDEIEVKMPADETDPAQWQPTVDEVLQLQQAELILLNGAGYSNWLDKVSLSDNALVVTSEPARDRWIHLEGQVTHSHGPEGEHAHGDYAFTTWMDMTLAQLQAQTVAAALGERWPEKREAIDRNLSAVLADLQTLDLGYAEAAKHLQGRQLVYSHPVYQYFERRYELPGISLHWEPNSMPTEEQWEELANLGDESVLFVWEAAPIPDIAEKIRELGIEFVVVDPAANTGQENWLAVHQQNIARLEKLK